MQQHHKRAATTIRGSKPSKQQKLNGMLSRGSQANLDDKMAAFLYADGIPLETVGVLCSALELH